MRTCHHRPAHILAGVIVLLTVGALSQPARAAPEPVTGMPVRLVIPAIAVDADVAAFDLTEDLAMPVPQMALRVAWYTFSAQAGAPGNAVLAGHRDWQRRRAVFYGLGRLQEGDEVWLQDAAANWYLYSVLWSISVPDDDTAPVEELVRSFNQASVTLITCSGTFDRSSGRYVERRVVRAELVATLPAHTTADEHD